MAYTKKPPQLRICMLCKAAFTTSMANKRFCTEQHRLEFRRKINELGQCPHCQRELLQA